MGPCLIQGRPQATTNAATAATNEARPPREAVTSKAPLDEPVALCEVVADEPVPEAVPEPDAVLDALPDAVGVEDV